MNYKAETRTETMNLNENYNYNILFAEYKLFNYVNMLQCRMLH